MEGHIRAMGIGLLGPLQIDGSEADLGRRDRAVLAALALSVGQPVSTDRLVDAVWGDHPPASAGKNLQGCILRLRRALGKDAVVTTPHGYRLDLPRDQLDICRFKDAVIRARELLAEGEFDRAGFVAEESGHWWRGAPLADLDGWELARSDRAHLEELRYEVEEIAVEALLRSGRSPEVVARAHELAEAAPLRERRWVLLARAQYQCASQASALATLRAVRTRLRDELGLDPGPELVALERSILRQDPALTVDERDPEVQTCPYRGLAPYDAEDADSYFGRGPDLEACLATARRGSTVSLVGPSGSGKSSLLRAGLAASFRGEGRRVGIVLPGAHLDRAVAQFPPPGPRSVLVVDQFEEVFALSTAEQQVWFIDAIQSFREAGGVLALGLRSDRLADLTPHPWLAREVEAGLHLLVDPDEQAIREIVEAPARQVGLRVEPGLVELLVVEMTGEPGALPLLSHCLLETWKRREARTLTVRGYQASGGVGGAVRQSAEAVYAVLPPDRRPLLRELMLRLVAPGDRNDIVRHRAPLSTIAFDADHSDLVDRLAAARLVTVADGLAEIAHEALCQAWPRLRSWLDEDVEGVRVQHHLMSTAEGWDRLGRPTSELYRGVRLAQALDWKQRSDPRLSATESQFLAAAQALSQEEERSAREQSRRQAVNIRRLRLALGGAAVLLVLALIAGFLALRQAEAARDTATVSEARGLGARALATPDPSLSLLLAAAGHRLDPGAVTRSNLQATIALHPELVASYHLGDADLGRLDVAPDGHSLLAQDLRNRVWRLDLSTGEVAADLEGRTTLGRWNWAGWPVEHHPSRPVAVVGLQNLEPSPLVLVDSESLELEPGQPGGLSDAPARASDVAFSADGRFLAAALQYWEGASRAGLPTSSDVRVWDLRRPNRPLLRVPTPPEISQYVALSPDGDRLFTSLPLRAYDVGTGKEVVRGRGGHWLGLEIDPAGRLLAHIDGDGVRLRSADTLTSVGQLGAGGVVRSLRFSHDGRLLAVAAADGSTTVWDVASQQRRLVLATEDHSVLGLGFSPDDATLYTGGRNGAVRAWDLRGDRRFVARVTDIPVVSTELGSMLLSPTGTTVAYLETYAFDPKAPWLRFVDVGTGDSTRRVPLRGTTSMEMGVAWAPDGSALAVGGRDGRVQLWNPVTGTMQREQDLGVRWLSGLDFDTPKTILYASQDGVVGAVETSALGQIARVELGEPVCCLAAVGADRAVVLMGGRDHESEYRVPTTGWALVELSTGRVVHRQPAPAEQVLVLDTSPDGERVAFGGMDGRLVVAEVINGEVIRSAASGHDGAIVSVSFSDDGQRIVTGGEDGTVRLWDGLTGAPAGAAGLSPPDSTSAWFNPGSTDVLITASHSGVHRWPTDGKSALQHACTAAGRDFTASEWHQYLGERPFEETCPSVGPSSAGS